MTWLTDNWLDILGWAGSAILVYSLLQARVLRFRAINTVGCVVLIVFNALLGVWPMVGMNLVLCAINVWFLVKLTRERHDDRVFQIVEVGRDDAFLQHVLDVHGADIARFQPDYAWQPAALRDHAFVVMHGDEVVGVLLLDADGDVARIRLDYVTPKYRDFTPGEFLWRRSGLLKAMGFRRVTSPQGMVGAYYGQVGFRSDGQAYVLEL